MIRTDLELLNIKKCVHGDTTTLYWRLGNPVLRRRKNRNAAGSDWNRTPGRERAVNKFTATKRLVGSFLFVLGECSSWRRAARLFGRNGQTGENFFFSRVHACIAADGSGVEDFRHFKLAAGRLPLPPGLRLTREGNSCTLEWEVGEEQPVALAGDLLRVGIIYDAEPDGLSLANTGGARRSDGKAFFSLDPGRGTRVHLYPYFSREDNSDFSDNDYFESEAMLTTPGKDGNDVENEFFEQERGINKWRCVLIHLLVHKVHKVEPSVLKVHKVKYHTSCWLPIQSSIIFVIFRPYDFTDFKDFIDPRVCQNTPSGRFRFGLNSTRFVPVTRRPSVLDRGNACRASSGSRKHLFPVPRGGMIQRLPGRRYRVV